MVKSLLQADPDFLVSACQIGLALCANNTPTQLFLASTQSYFGGCVFRWGGPTVVKPPGMGIQTIPSPLDSCLGSWRPQSLGQRTLAERQTDEGLQALGRSPGGHTRLLKLGTSIGQLGRILRGVSVSVNIRMDNPRTFSSIDHFENPSLEVLFVV